MTLMKTLRNLPWAFVVLLSVCAQPAAYADSIVFGAALRCDERQGEFELVGAVNFNDQTTIAASHLNGVRQLPYGQHQERCRVGRHVVTATLVVSPPGNGHCMGAGHVALGEVSIGPQREVVIARGSTFNFFCLGEEKELIAIRVKDRPDLGPGAVWITRCTATGWGWVGL
jgi:hypothetical protein